MYTGFMLVGAGLLLLIVAYAHRQIGIFTQGSANILVARLLLLVVGGVFGWLGAVGESGELHTLLRFLIGFGIVHIPAAVILFIKHQRGAGKS